MRDAGPLGKTWYRTSTKRDSIDHRHCNSSQRKCAQLRKVSESANTGQGEVGRRGMPEDIPRFCDMLKMPRSDCSRGLSGSNVTWSEMRSGKVESHICVWDRSEHDSCEIAEKATIYDETIGSPRTLQDAGALSQFRPSPYGRRFTI